jgi:peptidoglycan/xylan/chitin deacetylase (PgdA/CDA1 family)
MQQVYDYMESDLGLPSKPIILTFDDGYKDVFTYAVPVLKNYNYIGSFAIATNLLGRPSYAVWDDIIAASASGMEIVSHTENHLDLSNPVYSDADLHREIFDSKQLLEEKLGYNIDFFVYPYGRYNQKVLQMTQEAGYKMALTTIYGVTVRQESLLATPRVRVHGQDGLMKLKKIFLPAPQSAAALLSP